jgi:hypothetical protein
MKKSGPPICSHPCLSCSIRPRIIDTSGFPPRPTSHNGNCRQGINRAGFRIVKWTELKIPVFWNMTMRSLLHRYRTEELAVSNFNWNPEQQLNQKHHAQREITSIETRHVCSIGLLRLIQQNRRHTTTTINMFYYLYSPVF